MTPDLQELLERVERLRDAPSTLKILADYQDSLGSPLTTDPPANREGDR